MPRLSKTSTLHKKKNWILAVISFLLLFASYTFNIFGLWDYFHAFQKDSDSLIVNEIGCRYAHGHDFFGGQLVIEDSYFKSKNPASDYQNCARPMFKVYVPQFGLQGHIISFFAPSDPTRYLQFVRGIIAALLAATMTWLIIKIRQELSLTVALTLLAGLLISDWMVYMARSLYWVPVTMFLPFVFSFATYQKFKARGKILYFYLILGTLFFIKALNGYEFLTDVILSSFAPIIYWEIKEKGQILWKKLSIKFAKVMIAGVAGFLLALAANFTQAALFFHSPQIAFQAIQNRALDRTVGVGANDNLILGDLPAQSHFIEPELYGIVNQFYPLDHLKPDNVFGGIAYQITCYLFLGIYTIPVLLKYPLTTLLQSALFVIGTSAFILWRWHESGLLKKSQKHLALASMLVFSFASSISWFIFAHAHIVHHLHLDGISYYIPFAIVFYIMIGVVLDSALHKVKQVIS